MGLLDLFKKQNPYAAKKALVNAVARSDALSQQGDKENALKVLLEYKDLGWDDGNYIMNIAYACYYAGIGDSLNHMIVGAVIPLVPGVAFTNGIRDIGNEDYIAGTVRLLDAMLVFFGIAAGVGGMMMILRGLFGGGML